MFKEKLLILKEKLTLPFQLLFLLIVLYIGFVLYNEPTYKSEEWVVIDETDDILLYVDKENIVHNNDEVRVFLKFYFKTNKYNSKSEKPIQFTIEEHLYNCKEHKSKILKINKYYTDGKNMVFDYNKNSVLDLIPENLTEENFKQFCN